MATVTSPRVQQPRHLPTPEEIAAATAEIDAKRLAAFDDAQDRQQAKLRTFRGLDAETRRKNRMAEMEEARLARIATSFAEPGPDDYTPKCRVAVPEGGPVEMSAADIANVALVSDDEMQGVMLDTLDALFGTQELNDFAGRWTLGKVTPEDIGEVPPPFKSSGAPKPSERPAFRSAE